MKVEEGEMIGNTTSLTPPIRNMLNSPVGLKKMLLMISFFLLLGLGPVVTPVRARIESPIELYYDDGGAEQGLTGGVVGFQGSVRFSLPAEWTSAKILTAKYYVLGIPAAFKVCIYDSDGMSELTPPFTITPTKTGWFEFYVNFTDIIVTHDFYIAIEWTDAWEPDIGLDETFPHLRSYVRPSSSDSWVLKTEYNIMIRAVVGKLNMLHEIPVESPGGLGLAFDGNTLWYTGWPGSTVLINTDTSGTVIKEIDIGVSVGALAWDNLRRHLWAASADLSGKMYEVDTSGPGSIVRIFETKNYTDVDGELMGGFTDGLAYDWKADSLWFSPDQSSHVYQVSASTGSLVSKFSLPEGQDGIQSGVAFDGNYLWLGFRHDISSPSKTSKIRKYSVSGLKWWPPFSVSTGSEDLAWDPITFAPKCVVWEISHGLTPGIRAWEVSSPIPGEIVRVPEDYATLKEALDASVSGGEILVAPGVYREYLVINKNVTILGLWGSFPIFNGSGSGIALILLPEASGSTIAGIVITNYEQGVLFHNSSYCKIYRNIMSANVVAINLTGSSTTNLIYENIFSKNVFGINMSATGGNIIYHNNFINNMVEVIGLASTNIWDNGYPDGGNYWSTHTSIDLYSGPYQDEPGKDGIFDTGYTIISDNRDRYPLAKPFSQRDIGMKSLIKSKTVIGLGFILLIDLEILNYGRYNETFNATVYVGEEVIFNQSISLTCSNSIIITVEWDTSGFTRGNYTLSAVASIITDEIFTEDNALTDGWIIVATVGDVTGSDGWCDGRVNILDIAALATCFGCNKGEACYVANYDIDGDGRINIIDISTTALHFGEIDS